MAKKEPKRIEVARIIELMDGCTQDAFYQKTGVTQSDLSKILSGSALSADNILKITTAYDVSADWLLGISDDRKPTQVPAAITAEAILSEPNITPDIVCAMITKILEDTDATFETVKRNEIQFVPEDPFILNREPYTDPYRETKAEAEYLSIMFPNHWKFDEEAVKEGMASDDEDIRDAWSNVIDDARLAGTALPKNIAINDFINKLDKLRKSRTEKLITQDGFDSAIRDHIKNIPKK